MTAFNSKGRHEKLAITVHVLQNTYDFVISRCCFAEDGKEMDKHSKCTCRTIVLLIKPFVWRRSRCRHGLLKLPITSKVACPCLLYARSVFKWYILVIVRIAKFGPLREPMKILNFFLEQFPNNGVSMQVRQS